MPPDMREDAFGALRVSLAAADAPAAGRADRDGRVEISRAPIAQPRQLAHDLIESGIDVVGELDFRDGAQSVHPHADRRSDDPAFRDRGIEHPMVAILALQPLSSAEHAAEVADVLAHEHD